MDKKFENTSRAVVPSFWPLFVLDAFGKEFSFLPLCPGQEILTLYHRHAKSDRRKQVQAATLPDPMAEVLHSTVWRPSSNLADASRNCLLSTSFSLPFFFFLLRIVGVHPLTQHGVP